MTAVPALPVQDHPSPVDDAAGLVEPDLIEEDLLVEDVSIDGMCGVY